MRNMINISLPPSMAQVIEGGIKLPGRLKELCPKTV